MRALRFSRCRRDKLVYYAVPRRTHRRVTAPAGQMWEPFALANVK